MSLAAWFSFLFNWVLCHIANSHIYIERGTGSITCAICGKTKRL